MKKLKVVVASLLAMLLVLPSNLGAAAGGAAVQAAPQSAAVQAAPVAQAAPAVQDATAVRNIALHRAAYQSSCVNYNNTGHLVTDGIYKSGASYSDPVITSQYNDSSAAEANVYAFDGSAATKYFCPHPTCWIQYQFPAGAKYAVAGYTITTANDMQNRDPLNWVLYGVTDSDALVAVDTVNGGGLPTARGASKTFTISNPPNTTAYKAYRLAITANSGNTEGGVGWTQLAELAFMDAAGASVMTPYTQHFQSYWQPATTGGESVYIDLGGVSTFGEVKLQWDAANYASAYTIDVSGDASAWTTVYTTAAGAGGDEDVTFAQQTARYVRLSCKTAAGTAYMLYEFEVWGTNNVFVTPKPQPPEDPSGRLYLTGGSWKVQRASEVTATGQQLSSGGPVDDSGWLTATVPGTVLTSYLNDGAIPDPNFGDQQLQISDSFFTADFWYRDSFLIDAAKQGQQIFLNFNNINWKADVYFNGAAVGNIAGAFIRGVFNVTDYVNYGGMNYLAVYIHKNDTPGNLTVQSASDAGPNGGALGADNPTIHAAVGWDWVPTIRGRDIGIYGDVFLSYSGAVQLSDPWVETHLNGVGGSTAYDAAIDTSTAYLTYRTDVTNSTDAAQDATVSVTLLPDSATYTATVSVPAGGKSSVSIPITISNPNLWWPNRYGDQYLYTCQTSVSVNGSATPSDSKTFKVGIREMRYSSSGALSIYVNGARIYCTGGNWGMDEALLRCNTQEQYDIRVRLHKEAGFTMIRNWVGMTGNEEFYNACDKFGILVFDDFWLANPADGPNPNDQAMFMANAVDKIKVVRKHASLAFYCGRNAGNPPTALNNALIQAVHDYDLNSHLYISNSAGGSVTTNDAATGLSTSGGGPYTVQGPAWYFSNSSTNFHSERGMPNIPAVESVKKMMPASALWPVPSAMWGLHDFTTGSAQNGSAYMSQMNLYGAYNNVNDFVKIAQFVNYENFKALFEAPSVAGGNAMLLWMSQSAWPSMVWQTYDYYFDTNAGYFACKAANQDVNALYDQQNKRVSLTNNCGRNFTGLTVQVDVFDLYGKKINTVSAPFSLAPNQVIATAFANPVTGSDTNVNFIQTHVTDSAGKEISSNFYWVTTAATRGFTDFGLLDQANLQTSYTLDDNNGVSLITAHVKNYSNAPALMIRVKTLTDQTGQQVLPAYYSDNYFSLMPGQSKDITIEYDDKYLNGQNPALFVEGYNVAPAPFGAPVAPYSAGTGKFAQNGNYITMVNSGQITFESNISFYQDATVQLTPVIAVYKNNQLIDIKGQTQTVSGAAGQTVKVITAPAAVPSGDLTQYVVKGFLWDGDYAPILPSAALGAWVKPNPNLALNKPATWSSITLGDSGTTSTGGNDGSQTTRWTSSYNDNQTWTVDLGKQYAINKVVIYWEAAFAATFQIQVSNSPDGPWTAITPSGASSATINGVRAGNYPNNGQTITFSPVTAEYVRFNGLTRTAVNGTKYGFSFYEFEVYGADMTPDDIYFNPVSDQSALTGKPLNFLLSAYGSSGTGIVFSADSLPTGAALNPSTGAFSWTPAKDQVGAYTITFHVTNGIKTDSAAVTVTVAYDTAGDTAPPVWPGGAALTVSVADSNSVTLEWPAAADADTAVASYQLYQGAALAATLTSDVLRYTVRGLTASTAYTFSVVAADLAGNAGAPLSRDATTTAAAQTGETQTMWSETYPTAYSDWGNGFLAGNGKMGIIVFGNPVNDTIIYNDRGFNDAAKTATPARTFNTIPQATLDQIKTYAAAGDWVNANALANTSAGWKGGGDGNRHPGYKMKLGVNTSGGIAGYSRSTDFKTGEIAVNWVDDNGRWTRKSFVSRKDNVVVQYLTKPTGGMLSCSIELASDPGMNLGGYTFTPLISADLNYMNMRVNYPSDAGTAGYEGVTRVVTDGVKSVSGSVLSIANATYAILLTRTQKYTANAAANWNQQLIQAGLAQLPTDYSTLLNGQIATHGAIYGRVGLDLNAPAADRLLSNEALIAKQKASAAPVLALSERMFDAGRYHYLSSSWEQSPPDLLGLWTGDINVGWQGFYHTDANLNLQIAGGNIGNMPEAMAGYFHMIEAWKPDLETNAAKLLGCRGMLGPGNAPGPQSGLEASVGGAADAYYPYQYATGEMGWLLQPFWEHYQITGDKAFLQNDLLPMLEDMGRFYEDFLTVTDPGGANGYEAGKYIFAGSISPENAPPGVKAASGNPLSLVNNSTFDIAGAKFCLQTLIKTANILGVDQGAAGVDKWQAILDKLPDYRVNSDGALAEWAWPTLGESYGHRHSSQLIPVWPIQEITPEKNPALFAAAQTTLAKKDAAGNYEGAGHGLLHAALNAAELNNAASLTNKLIYFPKNDFYYNGLATSHYASHGTFCTDVANTVPGIMMEMLCKSDGDVDSAGAPVNSIVELLPALPAAMTTGTVTGIMNRNRTTTQSLTWDMNARTASVTLKSDVDQNVTVIERLGIDNMTLSSGTAAIAPSPLGNIARVVSLKAGVPAAFAIALTPDHGSVPVNLALNKTATASSESNAGQTAGMAVDGDMGTRWGANQGDAWWQVDLGDIYSLTGVTINWEASYSQNFQIQVSNTGAAGTWTTVYTNAANTSQTSNITLANVYGRYVKLASAGNGPAGWGISMYEFQVYGSPLANLALNKAATASSSSNTTDRAPFNANDGQMSTRWGANNPTPAAEWWQVDLGAKYTLTKINIYWEASYAMSYEIQVSDTGADGSWTSVYANAANATTTNNITLPAGAAGRYVRMQAHTNGPAGWGVSMYEFEAYGIPYAG